MLRTKADQELVKRLLQVHATHPFYGVRRLSLELGWSENKTRRIRRLAQLKIPVASKKHKYRHNKPEIDAPINALRPYAVFKDENRPQDGMNYSGMVDAEAWVQDFSFLRFNGCFLYLAVVLDVKTRQAVGWRLGTNHSNELTYAALLDALSKHSQPAILHSDQGSEYLSYKHQLICAKLEITLSASDKSSPWQNGFMERWFSTFKTEVGPLTRFKDLSEVHEAVAMQIHYYNTKRIHLALKTTPANYAKQLNLTAHKLSEKMVA